MELSVCAVVRVRVRETKPNQTEPNRTEAKEPFQKTSYRQVAFLIKMKYTHT